MKLAFTVLVVGLLASSSYACSCAAPPPPKESLKRSSAVFAAKVIKIETKGFEHVVTLDVLKSWKSVKENVVQVYTPSDEAACGVEFKEKEEWLIYAVTDP